MTPPRICLVIVWFGDWPAWMPWFLRSCQTCTGVDWLILSSTAAPANAPTNVHFQTLQREEFEARVAQSLGTPYRFSYGYKLCDLKPAYGDFFSDLLTEYDYWGYCDLDVIVGDLLSPILPALQDGADVVTASRRILVGHFTILRNTERIRLLYRECSAWRDKFVAEHYQTFDEADFSDHVKQLAAAGDLKLAEVPMVQEDSLVRWAGRPGFVTLWQNGRLRDVLAGRELGYFHFIQTKYVKSLVPVAQPTPTQGFYLTAAGFGNLDTSADRRIFRRILLREFLRTLPWYGRQCVKRMLPRRLLAAVRKVLRPKTR
jgi:hypothetical protein